MAETNGSSGLPVEPFVYVLCILILTTLRYSFYNADMKQSAPLIYNKIEQIEKELNSLKLQVYFDLPQEAKKRSSAYSQRAILRAIEGTREAIWRKRYAKKVENIS